MTDKLNRMFHLLLKHAKLITGWSLVLAVLSVGISLLFPKQYSATSQVLIISRDKTGVDPYTQARSAERIGVNLAQIMKTTDFFNKTLNSPAVSFNKDAWKTLPDRQQRKKWAKDVQATMIYGTGLMRIKVYAGSKEEAVNLSGAVTQTVSAQGWEYLGGDVAIKMVSTPLAAKWPARPNLPINSAVGLLAGFFLSSLWVVRRKKHLFGISV